MAEVSGTDGADVLYGTDQVDTINGLDGDDTIFGGFGADTLSGGSGNDLFRFNAVFTSSQTLPVGSIDGGSGYDTLDLRDVSPTTLGTIALPNGGYGLGVYVGSERFAISNIEQILVHSGFVDLPDNLGDLITVRIDTANQEVFVGGNYAVYGGSQSDTFLSRESLVTQQQA